MTVTEDFDAIMNGEFPEGIETESLDEDVKLNQGQRMVYYGLEAILFAIGSLHAEDEVLANLEGEMPEGLLEAPTAVHWLHAHSDGSFMRVLDYLVAWDEDRLVGRLAKAMVDWMGAHGLADHIHLIVPLPVVGYAALRLSQSDPVMTLPLPREALED